MPRRIPPALVAAQNRTFLDTLAHTGNVRLAVRLLGGNRATYIRRRAARAIGWFLAPRPRPLSAHSARASLLFAASRE